jgi:single-strand DNA-binding protein
MVNKVTLIGNLGDDPEVRHLENDNMVANIRIATNESYKDKNGEKKTITEWHNVELWGGLAKVASLYLKKGNLVYIEGKIKTEQWQDNEGNNRRNTRIRANNMTMLGGDKKQQTQSPAPAAQQMPKVEQNNTDELPF